ncbi:MAG: T9SS type A sorting domain-containing protein, partial [Flavobacteriales bacterium]
CQYPSSIDGCIQLSGIPTVTGTFSVPVNMTINIQIPAITDPIFGTVIFPATPLDMPAFAAQTYDLFINDATSLKNVDFRSNIYPNPSNSDFTIEVNSPMNLIIYNNFGQIVYSEKIINNTKINKSELGSGIFIIEISDKNSVEKHKLIIN